MLFMAFNELLALKIRDAVRIVRWGVRRHCAMIAHNSGKLVLSKYKLSPLKGCGG